MNSADCAAQLYIWEQKLSIVFGLKFFDDVMGKFYPKTIDSFCLPKGSHGPTRIDMFQQVTYKSTTSHYKLHRIFL
jgi:hypothetical protein